MTAFSTLLPGLMDDPYPAYAALRAGPPVVWSEPDAAWVLHRHGDVAAVLADPAFGVPEVAALVEAVAARAGRRFDDLQAFLQAALPLRNPPGHTEGRQFLAAALAGKPLATHAPMIAETARALLGQAPRDAPWDAAAGYADPLPRRVMARLLGLPDEAVAAWAATAMALGESLDRGRSLRFYARMDAALAEARAALDDAVAERRRAPREDGLSRMVALSDARFGFDDRGIASRALFLLFAGIETTSALIGNGIAALLDDGAAAARLRAEPGLADAATEETLRFDAPVQHISRIAAREASVAGQRVGSGERVVLLLGAANRDPAAHADPDRFELFRTPRAYLSFGGGVHFCLGAGLARLEAQIALREVFRLDVRSGGLRRWWPLRAMRRLAELPIVLSEDAPRAIG